MDNLDRVICDEEFFRVEDSDVEAFLKERKRLEDDVLEFKEDFDRNDRGNIKPLDFCKNIVGFSNTETGGFIIFGVKDNIKDSKVSFPDYLSGIELKDGTIEDLHGFIRDNVHRIVYVPIKIFTVAERKILVVKVPQGARKPYAYYDSSNGSYTYFRRTTRRINRLKLEEIESLYYDAFMETAQKLQTNFPSQKKVNNLENKIKSHQEFITPKLENIEDYGYWFFYCYPNKIVPINEKRLEETFTKPLKSYAETLNLSRKVETFQQGYTKGYFPEEIRKDIRSTYRVTCYYDGFIALDSQVDTSLNNNKILNLNEFTYNIQRHLQLCKEILEGYCEEINCWIDLRSINDFFVPIWYGNYINEKYHYQGTHTTITKKIKLIEIHGRDKWNIVFPAVIDIVKEIARVFGMKELPQKYWDENGYLNYAKVSGR